MQKHNHILTNVIAQLLMHFNHPKSFSWPCGTNKNAQCTCVQKNSL